MKPKRKCQDLKLLKWPLEAYSKCWLAHINTPQKIQISSLLCHNNLSPKYDHKQQN